jgi:hypothetical protein
MKTTKSGQSALLLLDVVEVLANQKTIIAIALAASLAACATPSRSPTGSVPNTSAKPAYCLSYESEAACLGRCGGLGAMATPAMCAAQECTPGTATEPPKCTPVPGCEQMQEAQRMAEYHSCLAACSSIPPECR